MTGTHRHKFFWVVRSLTSELAQAIPGVPPLPECAYSAEADAEDDDDAQGGTEGSKRLRPAANPATWVLDISRPAAEQCIGIDFAEAFAASSLARYGTANYLLPCPVYTPGLAKYCESAETWLGDEYCSPSPKLRDTW